MAQLFRTFKESEYVNLWSPFSSAVHPELHAVHRHSVEWAEKHKLGSARWRVGIDRCEIGGLAARTLPGADQDVVQLLSDFYVWFLLWDDLWEEEAAAPAGGAGERMEAVPGWLMRIARYPDAAVLTGFPPAEGLRDLSRRVGELGGPAVREHWVAGLRQVQMAFYWEAACRRARTLPELGQYAVARLDSVGAPAIAPLLQLGGGYELTADEWSHPVLRALDEMAQFVVGWDNDILSYAKEDVEEQGGGYALNAVAIVRERQELPLPAAVDVVVEQRDQVLRHYVASRHRFAAELTDRQARFLDDVETCLRGQAEWSCASLRYVSGPAGTADSRILESMPPARSSQPLPFPEFASWWEL